MSAESIIRELFRGLETTIHERLSMIEQVLHTVEKPKVPLYDSEFISRIERLERLANTPHAIDLPMNNSLLEERVSALEDNLASLFSDIEHLKETQSKQTFPSPILPLRSHTVDVLLSGDEKFLDEEPVVEVVENVQEEDLVEEEEELSLEEFEYKGKTYYKDEDNQVYEMDEEGDISEPIGSWNGKRIIPFSH
jgi:hypothetical protein